MQLPLPTIQQSFWLFVGCLFVSACCNIGFIQADEHFQILEFGAYKLGLVAREGLAWEYEAQIRSGIQPLMAYFCIGACRALGLTDPFWQAGILRVFAGVVSGWVYWIWLKRLLPDFKTEKQQTFFIAFATLSWFVPFLLVRFSSENMCAATFLGGLYLLLQNENLPEKTTAKQWRDALFAGFLFGLSFFFRFQIAFALLGLGAWLVFNRTKFSVLTFVFLGGLLGGAVGMLTDFWLYGEWVLSPVRYFVCNIIEHKAAEFGEEAFYWYFLEIPNKAVPPLGILLGIGFFVGCYHLKKHAFTWFTLLFVLGHAAVSHKEGRFLYPMLLPFMYLSAMGLWAIWAYFNTKILEKAHIWRRVFIFFLVMNTLILSFRIFAPADEMMSYHGFLYNYGSKHPDIRIVSLGKDDLYHENQTPFQQFYHPVSITSPLIDSTELQDYLAETAPDSLIITKPLSEITPKTKGYTQLPIYNLLPSWFGIFNINGWQERSNFWQVYLLTKKK
jgi:GPI mannosyltransferase 3